jgi:hypothetical protein
MPQGKVRDAKTGAVKDHEMGIPPVEIKAAQPARPCGGWGEQAVAELIERAMAGGPDTLVSPGELPDTTPPGAADGVIVSRPNHPADAWLGPVSKALAGRPYLRREALIAAVDAAGLGPQTWSNAPSARLAHVARMCGYAKKDVQMPCEPRAVEPERSAQPRIGRTIRERPSPVSESRYVHYQPSDPASLVAAGVYEWSGPDLTERVDLEVGTFEPVAFDPSAGDAPYMPDALFDLPFAAIDACYAPGAVTPPTDPEALARRKAWFEAKVRSWGAMPPWPSLAARRELRWRCDRSRLAPGDYDHAARWILASVGYRLAAHHVAWSWNGAGATVKGSECRTRLDGRSTPRPLDGDQYGQVESKSSHIALQHPNGWPSQLWKLEMHSQYPSTQSGWSAGHMASLLHSVGPSGITGESVDTSDESEASSRGVASCGGAAPSTGGGGGGAPSISGGGIGASGTSADASLPSRDPGASIPRRDAHATKGIATGSANRRRMIEDYRLSARGSLFGVNAVSSARRGGRGGSCQSP